jgi:hypothetical protein
MLIDGPLLNRQNEQIFFVRTFLILETTHYKRRTERDIKANLDLVDPLEG